MTDSPRDAAGAPPVLSAHRLSKTYRLGNVQVRALHRVSVAVAPGSIVCIVGRSGSGKSTLLRQLGLIDTPDSGTIAIEGIDVGALSQRRRSELRLHKLGYVFQEYALLEELTAQENVSLPAMMLGQHRRECRRRALGALDLVGLRQRARHRPKELSGGEQQRVAIARALVNKPRMLFADEPTANLDTVSASVVMRTLQSLNRELGVSVVFVSHEPDDRAYASETITMADGALVETP
jgi:putative ABC transport system ATP-binding protein